MAYNKNPPLEDRVAQLREEIETYIDARVDAEAKQSPGVPKNVIRNILLARSDGCLCMALTQLKASQ